MTTKQELGWAMLMLTLQTMLMLTLALLIAAAANAVPPAPKPYKGWWAFVPALKPDIHDEHTNYNIPGTDNAHPVFELYWDKSDTSCYKRNVWGYPYNPKTKQTNWRYTYRGRVVGGNWCAKGHPTEYMTAISIPDTPVAGAKPPRTISHSGTELMPYGVMKMVAIPQYAPTCCASGVGGITGAFGTQCSTYDGITTHGYCPSQQCEIKADPIYGTTGPQGSCSYIAYRYGFCRRGFGPNPKGCFCSFDFGRAYPRGSTTPQACFDIAVRSSGEFFPWPSGLPATFTPYGN